jgi:NTE family protein
MAKRALYLAGGGARGAYQAGVLKAISQILQVKRIPFSLVSGVSVGSINAVILAEYADDFPLGVEKLETLWRDIRCDLVFNASNYDFGKSLVRNLSRIFMTGSQPGNLLNSTPLKSLISNHVNFVRIKTNIAQNRLEAMEVISHCYDSQQTVSFYQHNKAGFEDWHYPRHISTPVTIGLEHILASSALPLFFPTINIDGLNYGDGSMGLVSPLRGALRFNVDKVLIIGTRQLARFDKPEKVISQNIGLDQILGNMLNGLFLDNLDRDIEMVNRMNDITQLLSMWKKRHSPWRPIETLHLRPSIDVAKIAQENYQTMPTLLRMMLNMLGGQSHSGDLLSFLLFEKEFTQTLIELGYHDTLASSDLVTAFFA